MPAGAADMPPWVADALASARVARLGTVDAAGAVRLVPICFAVVGGWVVSAVDHKPKRTGQLRRLDDMADTGQAAVLLDHYDDDDWSRLWWVRVRGRAAVHRGVDDPDRPDHGDVEAAVAALAAKYQQYRDVPPAGAVYRIAMDEVRWWRPDNADEATDDRSQPA